MTPEERSARRRASNLAYSRSEHGRAKRKEYAQSEAGREANRRYRDSEKGAALYKSISQSADVRERVAKTITEYRKRFPERRAANNKVMRALSSGKLKRQPCLVCGAEAVAHHQDYSRPLDVVWLCQSHHKQTHALVEEAA